MKPSSINLRSPKAWQLALACYWIALFVGTHLPSALPIIPGDWFDKLVHAAAFAVLAIFLAATWQAAAGQLVRRHLSLIWVVVALYGALDEWTQGYVGRDVSAGDWLADAVGAAAGLMAFHFWHRPGSKRRPRFSLKALFVLFALVAAGWFWLTLPTLNAKRFAAAMKAKDYAAAERLFPLGGEVFPGTFKDNESFQASVRLAPLTAEQLWHGERTINVGIAYGDGHGLATCAAEIRAARTGLELVILVP